MPGSIAIIGAGLGGMTAALALLRSGWRVRVYEQAPVMAEVGAGISLSSGAGKGLASLGVGPAILAASLPVPDVAFAHYRTGKLLAGTFDRGSPPDHGFERSRHIHRADLHAILLAAVRAIDPQAVITAKRLVRVDQAGDLVTATFADGSTADADLLIAADGSRSVVRRQLFDDNEPQFAGQVAYRSLVPRALAEPYLAAGNAVVSVGPAKVFHRYPVRGGEVINIVAIARNDSWRQEGWNAPATVEEFLAEYADFNDDVTGLIRQAPPHDLIKWGLFVRPPIDNWSRGRIALLGDAAHPILPFLGLGAALAMEDGVVLARALDAAPTYEAGLAAYQQARFARVENVRTQTLLQGELTQTTDPDNYDLTRSPSQNIVLFDYDPTKVPIHV